MYCDENGNGLDCILDIHRTDLVIAYTCDSIILDKDNTNTHVRYYEFKNGLRYFETDFEYPRGYWPKTYPMARRFEYKYPLKNNEDIKQGYNSFRKGLKTYYKSLVKTSKERYGELQLEKP